MKNKELYKDDFLKNLIQKVELDSPSDDFVTKVMMKCEEVTIQEVVKSRFRIALPWITFAVIFIALFALTFIFGGSILGGTVVYDIFTGSLGTIGGILLKGLATMKLAYVGIGLGIISGFVLFINKMKQNLAMRVV